MKQHSITEPIGAIAALADQSEGKIDDWIERCAAIFQVTPLNHGESRNDYRAQSWFIDPIMIANSEYCDMAAAHGKWHVEESGGQIHVHRYVYGRASAQSDGIPIESETGDITLLDYGRPFSSLHMHNRCESFFVPYAAIGYRPSDASHAIVHAGHSRMGCLIGREMDNLQSQLKSGASFIDPDDVQRFLGCVEVAMCPNTASASARARMRESLKRSIQLFVEERLCSTQLNATLILQNFGVSRASLYRMFDTGSGVRSYINRRRLTRAVTDLAAAPHVRGQIHKVAERWGFTSDATFNRMVKREFGVAPGSLFQMPIHHAPGSTSYSEILTMMLTRANSRQLDFA